MLHVNIRKYGKIHMSLVDKFAEATGPDCKHLQIVL